MTPTKTTELQPACDGVIRCTALLAAVAEYFDWLTNAEIAAEEMGNVQYRDAMARASSELGLMLIKHKIYEPEKAANAEVSDPAHKTP